MLQRACRRDILQAQTSSQGSALCPWSQDHSLQDCAGPACSQGLICTESGLETGLSFSVSSWRGQHEFSSGFWIRYSTKSYKKPANAKLAHQWFGGNFELWEQTPTWSVLCIVQPQHALSRTGSFKSGFIVSSNRRSKNLLEVGSGYTSAVP